MFRSQSAQVAGFTLLSFAVAGFVITQVFQCSVSTELVSFDEFFDPSVHPLMDVIYNEGSVQDAKELLTTNPEWAKQPIYFGWYAVHCAGQAGRLDILELLIEFGADIHAVGPDGANMIVSAIESDDAEILNFVLDAGVDLHVEYPDGTPLEYIRNFGSAELNRVLDERGLPKQSP